MLDRGAPWQTVRAENKLFKMLHGDASRSQTVFRALSMIPALYCRHVGFTRAGNGWVNNLGIENAPRSFAGTSHCGGNNFRGVQDLSLHADYDSWHHQHIFDCKPEHADAASPRDRF